MDKNILHCDCNNFFASCECLIDPSIRDKPVVVAGRIQDRHGVILAKNYIAKNWGITTGMRLFEADRICPNLIVRTPHMDIYNSFSIKIRKLFTNFTDRVECFSIDECFLDVTHSKFLGSPEQIADNIRECVKKEIGLSISVGVSFCKVFAKIGSDMKKPDATTVITKDNYKQKVWPLPVSDMIGVGKHIHEKFTYLGINTIGDLANFPIELLIKKFGKIGKELWEHANGIDNREVALYYDHPTPKSVGNSATFYRDLKSLDEVFMALNIISQSISTRMLKLGLYNPKTIQVIVKNNLLQIFQKQCKLPLCNCSSSTISNTAFQLFNSLFYFNNNVRMLGISVSGFDSNTQQLNIFDIILSQNKKNLDEVLIDVRKKYGYNSIGIANKLLDSRLSNTLNRNDLFKEMIALDESY